MSPCSQLGRPSATAPGHTQLHRWCRARQPGRQSVGARAQLCAHASRQSQHLATTQFDAARRKYGASTPGSHAAGGSDATPQLNTHNCPRWSCCAQCAVTVRTVRPRRLRRPKGNTPQHWPQRHCRPNELWRRGHGSVGLASAGVAAQPPRRGTGGQHVPAVLSLRSGSHILASGCSASGLVMCVSPIACSYVQGSAIWS